MLCFFFFNDTATTEIYTLSLHDALPISKSFSVSPPNSSSAPIGMRVEKLVASDRVRSEEHTSELQSRQYLVCRLLLEKKKKQHYGAIPFETVTIGKDVVFSVLLTSSAVH